MSKKINVSFENCGSEDWSELFKPVIKKLEKYKPSEVEKIQIESNIIRISIVKDIQKGDDLN